jgi:hypothetical protein
MTLHVVGGGHRSPRTCGRPASGCMRGHSQDTATPVRREALERARRRVAPGSVTSWGTHEHATQLRLSTLPRSRLYLRLDNSVPIAADHDAHSQFLRKTIPEDPPSALRFGLPTSMLPVGSSVMALSHLGRQRRGRATIVRLRPLREECHDAATRGW